jgi:hypothetical protein
MNFSTLSYKSFLTVFLFIVFCYNSKAQVTKALNQLIPMDLVDERSETYKTVMGIGSGVNISIVAGIKYIDACSNADFGNLKVEITWHNANDETGKYMLQMMKEMNVAEQDKKNFLNTGSAGKIEDFSGGTLKIYSDNKACVNEITGSTGKVEHSTEARYFSFKGSTILKITFLNKIKPETAKNIISKIADDVAKFDFSVYSNTIVDERN